MNHPGQLRRRAAGAAVAITLLAAGCGTGPGDASPTGATSPAAGGSPTAAATATAASPSGLRAVYVSTGPIGQNPFLELIVEGLEAGGSECGVETRVVESADTPTMEDNLQAAIDEGYDLIVTNSFDAVDAVTRLAGENPDQQWAIVDSVVDSPNVRGLLFKEHEGAYLLGATLGLLATGDHEGFPASERIGAVGAVDAPFIRRWLVGFEEGAKAVYPEVTIDSGWATGFNDPATSKELALAQNDRGAEYVFAFSAAGNTGVFEAAAERDFLTTGVDTDQRALDPEHIVESMVKRTDVGVQEAVCDLAAGQFSGGVAEYGLAEQGVGPAFIVDEDLDPPSTIPDEVQEQVRELADQVVSGEIVVTDFLAQP
ncbi:MAG TPA: BMP family ABC transporter substrate-binding protein [Vitreimonas sp.]|nr:BMP family ABC transporter substrate-binding protein [Vitreimonas sp.]